MRHSLLLAVLSLSLLLSAVATTSAASYTFAPIDVPDAAYTFVFGINKQGEIVGTYIDSRNTAHGFLYSHGLFTTLDVPEAVGTDCLSINNQGQIVGLYRDSHGESHSFLYDRGEFTTFQLPNSVWTDTRGINDSSQIVGSYQDSNQGLYGFLFEGGGFTTIAVPGAFLTSAHGINIHGQIVGLYQDSNNVRHGFLYERGGFTTIDVPPGASHAATDFLGINASGQIVGYYYDGRRVHGFLYEGGIFTTIDGPGAIDTFIYGINDEGQIVGGFTTDVTAVLHSFVATPVVADTTSPLITVSASPATLWPPNGKLVTVAVSGAITDGGNGSGVQASTYQVTDEYSQIQPSGSLTLEADGSYAFTVKLEASRNGNDRDGRRYTIEVSATDNAGNEGAASTTVTVPRK